MKIEAPKVMTTVECRKCGSKSVREFQRGDFVFKELDSCQKCDDKQLITAIYKEVKEKEKTYGV
jgi:ribosomal protein L40E